MPHTVIQRTTTPHQQIIHPHQKKKIKKKIIFFLSERTYKKKRTKTQQSIMGRVSDAKPPQRHIGGRGRNWLGGNTTGTPRFYNGTVRDALGWWAMHFLLHFVHFRQLTESRWFFLIPRFLSIHNPTLISNTISLQKPRKSFLNAFFFLLLLLLLILARFPGFLFYFYFLLRG